MPRDTEAECEYHERRLTQLEHAVYGNGQPGIKDRMNSMEHDMATVKYLGRVLVGLVATSLSGIVYLVMEKVLAR
jgi:hypothetical protein